MKRCILGMAVWLAAGCGGADTCRGHDVDGAWRDYTAGRIDEAYDVFSSAVDRCPSYTSGQLGLGYAALRRDELELARRMFGSVLSRQPRLVDALVGSGIVDWRLGNFAAAQTQFRSALAQDPENESVQSYLRRFPAEAGARRPPLVRPDSLVFTTRIAGARFEVRGQNGWEPYYVKGVNIGAAIPGHHPSEFPDSSTYAAWFRLIGAMGANTVRIYTVHPPHFYQALRQYNLASGSSPLRLLHGIWAELPPDEFAYDDAGWRNGFYQDLRTVVDVVHGRADVPLSPGRASGHYNADVAPWTLGFILGREWEPRSVLLYNRATAAPANWAGTFVGVSSGTPMDVWLARAIEQIVAYETATYGAQRPIAYTNWPPTDPLRHGTEPDLMEEVAIRRAFGDTTRYAPIEDGNDAVTLDPLRIRSLPSFKAGYFAAYHVYPYYPDFMVLDPDLNQATSPFGRSNYWGYLVRLQRHHGAFPVLVAEYGVPTSIGIAHFQPQGWHHGGSSERAMAQTNARLTREIAAAGLAGGVIFAWIDEWFKQTWNTQPFEVPRERARLWRNRMNAEEHYGMLAAEPANAMSAASESARRRSWQAARPLIVDGDGVVLRAHADEAYFSVRVEFGASASPPDRLLLGFDVMDPAAGEFRWPSDLERLPVGVEFVLTATPDSARILGHPAFVPLTIDTLGLRGAPRTEPPFISSGVPGFFAGRFAARLRQPLQPVPSNAGRYEPLRVLSNRLRFGRDSTEYPAMGYEWGVLPEGAPPDGLWEWRADGFEARIPWQLLNVADPSQRRVLLYSAVQEGREPGTVKIPGIRIVLGLQTGEQIRTLPKTQGVAPLFAWPTWDTPEWKTRVRPSYWSIREAWQTIGRAGAISRTDTERP